MRWIIFAAFLLPTAYVNATDLPSLPGQQPSSAHKLFLTSESHSNQTFDVWKIDSGYSYSLLDSVDIYVGARIDNAKENSESGFLSGISYQFNDRVIIKSTLHAYKDREVNPSAPQEAYAAEISSRVKIADNLDLHATFDYEELQKGIELGLGFRF